MTFDFALQGLLPLIVFAIVDIFAGMRTGIIAAIIFAVFEAAWSWQHYGEVDKTTWISLGLILAMGLISVRMKDDRLFKFQPVVMAGVFAVTMGWFQWSGDPLLLQMLPKVKGLMPPDKQWVLSDGMFLKRMVRLDLMMVFAFIAHGVIVAWAAMRKTTLYWLIARGVGLYVVLGAALLIALFLPVK